ncbi:MAG TPA: hypothetical protein VKT82_30885 [Ktedonobacterales bacterium]|nr:hypothetical protein [Ktedonobacterales bacterium]
MVQATERSRVYPHSLEYLISLHFLEDYEALRHEAQDLKTNGEDAATRALGAFFFEHAGAMIRWITSYDYEAIREREEAAQQALREQRQAFPDPDGGAVIFALEALASLAIEGTHIENGMIASDPLPMFEHSKRLAEGLQKALE